MWLKAQNEMRAFSRMPQWVRLSEWLGGVRRSKLAEYCE